MRSPAVVLTAVAVALTVLPMPAAGLTCASPQTGWAELTVRDLDRDEAIARVPFDGSVPGYGCNVGNVHDLREGWLAWVADGGPILHVLELGTGNVTSFRIPDEPEALGVDPPHVVALEREGNRSWIARRHTVDPAAGLETTRSLRFPGRDASVHGTLLHLLDPGGDRPTLSVYDLAAERYRFHEEPIPDRDAGPWRLLGGDGTWAAVASRARYERHGEFLDEDATVWLHRIGTSRMVPLPSPRLDSGGPGRWGTAVDFDAATLYNEIWQPTLPWSPADVQARRVPDGTPSIVDFNGSLMRGIAVDDGWLVVGAHLDAVPDDPSPWIQLPPDRPGGEPVPGPGFLAAAVALAAGWLVRHRDG